MKVVGIIRAKNAERWITDCLYGLSQVCSTIIVLNDHSTDNTAGLVFDWSPIVELIDNPVDGQHEARDRQFLTVKALQHDPDWIIQVDADEVLLDPVDLLFNLKHNPAPALSFHILHLWDRPDQIRVDGVYGNFWRPRAFRPAMSDCRWAGAESVGPNIHCYCVPTDLGDKAVRADPRIRLKHYGPMLKEDRLAKYRFYRSIDPNNPNEDDYRHSVQGDLPEFPADARYRFGGPLKLIPWKETEG